MHPRFDSPLTRGGFIATAAAALAACGVATKSATSSKPATSRPAPAAASSSTDAASTSAGTRSLASASVVPAALVGATTIDGQPFDANVLAGRPTVVWFWAPWCVICRREAPNVVTIASRYAGKVNFVGVAGRGKAPEMRDFVKETHTEAITCQQDLAPLICK